MVDTTTVRVTKETLARLKKARNKLAVELDVAELDLGEAVSELITHYESGKSSA
ncbi:MAG: hypothetical protein ACFFD4_07965 [Candidatus Odinarchaeota archaeon]